MSLVEKKIRTHFNDRFQTCFNHFVENLRQPYFLDCRKRRWLIVDKRRHDVHGFIIINQRSSIKPGYLPRGKRFGPNSPRYSMIFLIDCGRVESIRPRSPSDVPVDCIMRCMERSVCLSTAALGTGSCPAAVIKLHFYRLTMLTHRRNQKVPWSVRFHIL